MDVAAQIIPASVHIKSLVNPATLQILEQNYEYDLLSPQKLMDKYVGKELKLYQRNPYTEREEVVAATLLATTPVFSLALGVDTGEDRPTLRGLAGAFLAVAGVAIMSAA